MIRHNYRPHVNRVHVNWAHAPTAVAVAPAPAPVEVAAEVPFEEPDYSTLTKADLVALADERGLDPSGTKAEIVERLNG